MKKELMDILVCPTCKGSLKLTITSEDTEIVAGTLTCFSCGQEYPIEDGIPNLLPKHLRD